MKVIALVLPAMMPSTDAAQLRGKATSDAQQAPSSFVRRVQTSLYRGDKPNHEGKARICGKVNNQGLLNVTPYIPMALDYSGDWRPIQDQLKKKHLENQQEFEAKMKTFQRDLGTCGWLQMMTIDQKLFEVTEDSLKSLFADTKLADKTEPFQWEAVYSRNGLKKVCTRANMIRLGFGATCDSPSYIVENCEKPQSSLEACKKVSKPDRPSGTDKHYLYPATFALKKIFPDAQGWFFLKNSAKHEFMLWNSVEKCNILKVQDFFNQENPTEKVLKVREDFRKQLSQKRYKRKMPDYDFGPM